MREHGIQGAKRRGRPWRTTIPDPDAQPRPDLVNRDFTAVAPDRLWVGDFTYLKCWEGRLFFSFIIDVFSRQDRRLAARLAHAHRPRARCAADGARDPPAWSGLRAGSAH
jgi:transposase InsO family protein